MPDPAAQTPNNKFRFMSLPCELRTKIQRFATIKPDGYIGQADDDGVNCALGAKLSLNKAFISADPFDHFHFPAGCRHPLHEKKQIFRDFREYRCVNLLLTCRQMYEEVTCLFFKENGFELRDAYDMIQFFLLIGPYRVNLIQKLRLYYNINLTVEDFQALFEHRHISKTFYQKLELEYLDNDEPSSDIVRVLNHLKSCKNVKDFDLVYRLQVPGHYFSFAKAAYLGYDLGFAGQWSGQSMQWNVHTEYVLEKLRQDNGEHTSNIIDVGQAVFTANDLAYDVAVFLGREEDFKICASILGLACIAHAENCIENTAVGQNRIMDAAHFEG